MANFNAFKEHFYVRIILNIILLLVELYGDEIPHCNMISMEFRLTLDNGVHGLIAALSWTIVIDYAQSRIYHNIFEVFLCGTLGSFIDLDHFLEARSFHLKDALNLTKRPLFHNTLLLILVVNLLLVISMFLTWKNLWRLSWITLTAGLSHHLRDGIKHGLLLDPLESTVALPYWSYILTTALLPHLIRLVIVHYEIAWYRNHVHSLGIDCPEKK